MDEVRLAYTKYESALTQRPTVIKLLPMPTEELVDDDDEQARRGTRPATSSSRSPRSILDLLLPRYVEGSILQGCSRPPRRSTPLAAGR